MIATVAEVRPQLVWDELAWVAGLDGVYCVRSAAGFETAGLTLPPPDGFRIPRERHPGPGVTVYRHRPQSRYLDPRGPVLALDYTEARWAPAWLPLVGYALDPDDVLEALAAASLAFRIGLSATFQEFGAAVALATLTHAVPGAVIPGSDDGRLAREIDRDWRARLTPDETRWWHP